ncbi:acyltransferase family protein [Herbiconiux moechotypicola]|uniref:Acyltransferase family protein n=1 Tax=Herbiconiux moechotypicola TaxID=637393 RepID=A0ABN3E2R5_9MICO
MLVVLLHLFVLHYIYFFYGSPGSELVSVVVDASLPLRMPLFFLVSGYLAARALWRPWAAVGRRRVWLLVYLYGVWIVLNALFDLARERLGHGGSVDPVRFVAENLIEPQTALWYLYALVVFFLVTRLTRSWSLGAVLALGIAASVVGTTFFDGLPQHLLRSFVFYALAARAPQIIDWVASRTGFAPLLATAASYAALTTLYFVTSIDFGVLLVAGAVGVALGIQLAVRLGAKRIAAPFRYLGRHTLAIFLVHPFVFVLVNDFFLEFPEAAEAIRDRPLVVAVYPWLLLAATLAVCVGLEALATRIGLGFLFTLPRFRRKAAAR